MIKRCESNNYMACSGICYQSLTHSNILRPLNKIRLARGHLASRSTRSKISKRDEKMSANAFSPLISVCSNAKMRRNSTTEDGGVDTSTESSSGAVLVASASDSVVQNFVNILNKNDVHSIIEVQKQILDALEKVDEMSVKCIEINEQLLKQKKSEIAEIMVEAGQVKALLQSIFGKIALLKREKSGTNENVEKRANTDSGSSTA